MRQITSNMPNIPLNKALDSVDDFPTKMYDFPMIDTLLKDLGLHEKQIRTYLTLYERGKTTPADLSVATGINRTTTYTIAKELIEKGLVANDLGSKKHYLVALPPESLAAMVKKEETELKKRKVVADQAANELRKLTRNVKHTIPKIHFVYEVDLESFLHKQVGAWCESAMRYDAAWWGFQDATLLKCYGKWIRDFWPKYSSDKLTVRLLTNESKFEEEMRAAKPANRITKFWGEDSFSATTWVVGDYLVLIVTNQKPHYLVQIHDAKLCENMRGLFRGIWKTIR